MTRVRLARRLRAVRGQVDRASGTPVSRRGPRCGQPVPDAPRASASLDARGQVGRRSRCGQAGAGRAAGKSVADARRASRSPVGAAGKSVARSGGGQVGRRTRGGQVASRTRRGQVGRRRAAGKAASTFPGSSFQRPASAGRFILGRRGQAPPLRGRSVYQTTDWTQRLSTRHARLAYEARRP